MNVEEIRQAVNGAPCWRECTDFLLARVDSLEAQLAAEKQAKDAALKRVAELEEAVAITPKQLEWVCEANSFQQALQRMRSVGIPIPEVQKAPPPPQEAGGDMFQRKTLAQLAAEQGVKPIKNLDDLVFDSDLFDDDTPPAGERGKEASQ